MAALYHVANVMPRNLSAVMADIRKLGFVTFNPTRVEARRRRHLGWVHEQVPIYPGYLFVRFDPKADYWRPICSTRGVGGLLGSGPETPYAISDAAMAGLIEAHANGALDVKLPQKVEAGGRGLVTAGMYASRIGECLSTSAKRVLLELEMFGGRVRASLPQADVVAA